MNEPTKLRLAFLVTVAALTLIHGISRAHVEGAPDRQPVVHTLAGVENALKAGDTSRAESEFKLGIARVPRRSQAYSELVLRLASLLSSQSKLYAAIKLLGDCSDMAEADTATCLSAINYYDKGNAVPFEVVLAGVRQGQSSYNRAGYATPALPVPVRMAARVHHDDEDELEPRSRYSSPSLAAMIGMLEGLNQTDVKPGTQFLEGRRSADFDSRRQQSAPMTRCIRVDFRAAQNGGVVDHWIFRNDCAVPVTVAWCDAGFCDGPGASAEIPARGAYQTPTLGAKQHQPPRLLACGLESYNSKNNGVWGCWLKR